MAKTRRLMLGAIGLLAAAAAPAAGQAPKASRDVKLPAAVRKTFEANFPGAQIEKVESEEEGGVTVYDLEFRQGTTEKETDIAADGTMLEYTVVIDTKAVPAAAMAPIREAARGATMGRTEEIKISYETRGGKVIKLPRTVTHYAVELKKGTQSAEIVVDPSGKVIEEAKFGAEDKDKK